MRIKRLLQAFVFVCVVFFSATSAFAQNKTVSGTITDQNGTPLSGATVTVKGQNISAATQDNGTFTISVPTNARTLVVSYVGMTNQEISINNRTTVAVKLNPVDNSLNEVVVIGYGTQKRQDVNGAVSTIRASEIANIPMPSVDQLLQGRAAGVTVTQNSGQPGSAVSVRIRGVTSISGTNEPLYVIDGVPVSGAGERSGSLLSNVTEGGAGASNLSPLATLNPSDILTIDVLKDASATAIYGNRASNGVVIITTKKGRNGTSRISYDGYLGLQTPAKLLDVMDLQQYAKLQNEMAAAFGQAPRAEFRDISLLGKGTDWQREIFQEAPMQSHQLSFSGGKDNVQFYTSAGYLNQKGMVLGSEFKRYTFRANIDAQVKSWFKLGVYMTGARTNERIAVTDAIDGVISLALYQAPDIAVRNFDGSFAGPKAGEDNGTGQFNPVAQASLNKNNYVRDNLYGTIFGDITILKNLTWHSEIGGSLGNNQGEIFRPSYEIGRFNNPTAILRVSRENNKFWNTKHYLTYKKVAGKHDITALAGFEAQESRWERVTSEGQGFQSNDVYNLRIATTTLVNRDYTYKGSNALVSYYARAIYSFNRKYGITATVRADGSSKFSPDGDQWGLFPAVAASWRISEESFMQGISKTVSNLRLRLGYGQVGNQNIDNYAYGASLRAFPTPYGTAFAVANFQNPKLKWETAIQKNAGIDFTLLNNKIDVTFDVYEKTSKNFLFRDQIPSYLTGVGAAQIQAPFVNGGKVRNRGFDLSITSRNITKGDFTWNTTLNLSHYKNKVLSLLQENAIIDRSVVTGGGTSVTVTRTQVGAPISQFYGYRVIGLYRDASVLTGPNPPAIPAGFSYAATGANTLWLGDVQYEDVSGPDGKPDGIIDQNDRVAIGDPNPDFTFGLNNSLTYKGFDLGIFVTGSVGNDGINLVKRVGAGLFRLYNNQLASAADYYSASNPDGEIPRPTTSNSHPNHFMSERYVEDASFVRIQNISLGYTLPTRWVNKAMFNRVRIYGSVQNLYTFTNYTGYDSELGSYNQDALRSGVDIGRYPIPRTITVGINAEF
jgi:TonB-linked SusC/RagA family outer membrane protein